jgi:hypothetical protein
MAEDEKKSLPKITTKNYWGIRKKLKSTMPKTITKSFVAAALNIKENSAQMNVVGPMKQMGLIDDKGSPTSLANEWRDDDKYAAACKKIREKVYPEELLDLAPDAETDKSTIQNWIANHFMTGEESARQSTGVYLLLLEADASKQDGVSNSKVKTNSRTAPKSEKKTITKKVQDKIKKQDELNLNDEFKPSIHIDLQIHISPDASAEQIDKIFASMSKHIFKRRLTQNEE